MKLDKTVDILSGYAFNSSNFNNEGRGTPLIRIRDVNANQTKTFFDGNYPKEYLVENGDLLVGMDGNFNLVEWRGGRALMNQRICKIIPKKDLISKDFIKYLMPKSLKEIEDRTSFATVKHLSVKKIKEIKLPNYNLKTQQRIAEILDNAAALRDKTAQLLKEYDLLAQAIFLEMFGDPVTNPKGWGVDRMDKICSKVTDGTHDTPERLSKGVKFITGKHIRPYKIDYENSDYVYPEVHKEIYRRCNPELNDVLYTNIGVNLGTAALNIVDYEFSMKNVALLKCNKSKIIGRYLEYFLNSKNMKEKILWISSIGGAQKFLSLNQLRSLKVLVPPMSLQNQFAEKIALIDQQKELAKQELKESEDLFNCLLQKAFKGELV
jgi:type I restriction enzyme S subunit